MTPFTQRVRTSSTGRYCAGRTRNIARVWGGAAENAGWRCDGRSSREPRAGRCACDVVAWPSSERLRWQLGSSRAEQLLRLDVERSGRERERAPKPVKNTAIASGQILGWSRSTRSRPVRIARICSAWMPKVTPSLQLRRMRSRAVNDSSLISASLLLGRLTMVRSSVRIRVERRPMRSTVAQRSSPVRRPTARAYAARSGSASAARASRSRSRRPRPARRVTATPAIATTAGRAARVGARRAASVRSTSDWASAHTSGRSPRLSPSRTPSAAHSRLPRVRVGSAPARRSDRRLGRALLHPAVDRRRCCPGLARDVTQLEPEVTVDHGLESECELQGTRLVRL